MCLGHRSTPSSTNLSSTPSCTHHHADRTGNFERGIDTLHTPIGWNKDTQAQIAFSIAAREACVDVAAIYQAVDELNQILPSTITQRLPPANVARMALYKRDHIAQRMVELRSVLPKGDLGQVVAGCPSVLWWPMKQIESTLQELRCLFGGTEDDSEGLMALLEAQPVLLEPGVAGSVCEEMERLFGVGEDPAKRLRMLVRNPSLVLSLMPLHAQV